MYNVEFEFRPSDDESRRMAFIIKNIIDPICRKWDQEFSASCGYFSEFLRGIRVIDDSSINANMADWGQLTICRGLLQMKSKSVYKGVIAHEFGHRLKKHHNVYDMDFYELPEEEQLQIKRSQEFEADLKGAEILEWAGLGYKDDTSTFRMMAFMLGEVYGWVSEEDDDVVSDHPSLRSRLKNLATKDPSIIKEFEL